jgi:hypothetical protein
VAFASTDGPVEHAKTSCAAGHVLTPTTASLAVTPADTLAHPSPNPPPPQPLTGATRPIVPVGRRRAAGTQPPRPPPKVPSIVALPILDGNPDYIRWILDETMA